MYEQCPNGCEGFTLFSVELDRENDAIIYDCAVCDWAEIEHNPFYVSDWIVRVEQALFPIDIVRSLLTSEDTVEFLRPRLKGESFLSNRDSSAWKFTVGSNNYLQGEVDIAHQIYLRQMIVLAATYIELILKDFLNSFSKAKPTDLFNLQIKTIEKGKGKKDKDTKEAFVQKVMGAITFEKIMNGDAREAMLDQAFHSMNRAERWRIVEYLANHAPVKDQTQLFGHLKTLTAQRDDFVHSSLHDPLVHHRLDVQQVYDGFRRIINLLCVLEKIAEKNSIPYWKDFDCEFNEFIK